MRLNPISCIRMGVWFYDKIMSTFMKSAFIYPEVIAASIVFSGR